MEKREILEHYFGYGEFLPGQEELIDGILSKRDVFGICEKYCDKSQSCGIRRCSGIV